MAFKDEYPRGARADEAGRLTHDIEGRPLTAEFVAGRRYLGEIDGGLGQALSPEGVAAIAERSAGASIEDVAPGTLGKDVGRLVKTTDRRSRNSEYENLLRRGLDEQQRPRVAAHEVGHLIDDIAGRIPTGRVAGESRRVYDTLNNPNRSRDGTEAASWGPRHCPQDFGYKGKDISRELMAEAIRAYMADPNYMKATAPDTATLIRKYVNSHPRLSQTIQFNSLAGGLGLGAYGYANSADQDRSLP
jgi:hypothetical protein